MDTELQVRRAHLIVLSIQRYNPDKKHLKDLRTKGRELEEFSSVKPVLDGLQPQ